MRAAPRVKKNSPVSVANIASGQNY